MIRPPFPLPFPSPRRPREAAFALPLAAGALLLVAVAPAGSAQAQAAPSGAPPRIEVAFALDATGSMGPWIHAARARIRAIAEDLASGDPPPEVRFALVGYRDKEDAYTTRVEDFTKDLDEMKRRLDATRAEGGGDYPEAVLEALAASVRELDWSADDPDVVKLLYLVGDAPPNRYDDSPVEDVILAEALDKGIVIHTIACGSMDSRGQAFFERVARLSEGRPYRLDGRGGSGRARAIAGSTSAAGATGATSLAEAVSGSAKAYSGAAGVRYAPKARPREVSSILPTPALPASAAGTGEAAPSGLLGAHLRHVADQSAFSDLWRAHASLAATAPPPPAVDFALHHVLVLGGEREGLELVRVERDERTRFAVVRPSPRAGVRFYLIPAGTPVAAAPASGGSR